MYRVAVTNGDHIVYRTDWVNEIDAAKSVLDEWNRYLRRNPGYGESAFIEKKTVLIERLEPRPKVTRDDVIAAAVRVISQLPQYQLEELKRNFDRAEAEAERILNHPGSRQ